MTFKGLVRKMNHYNAAAKDVKAMGIGDTKKIKRRVKNNAKGKAARDIFKLLG